MTIAWSALSARAIAELFRSDSMKTFACLLASSSRLGVTSVAFMLAERSISTT